VPSATLAEQQRESTSLDISVSPIVNPSHSIGLINVHTRNILPVGNMPELNMTIKKLQFQKIVSNKKIQFQVEQIKHHFSTTLLCKKQLINH